MSSFQAIAAVTATIRTILELEQLPVGTDVTTHPPEKAKPETESQSRLNVFCYRTSINGAWRNQDLPGRVRSGETGRPALPLNLHYAITAFGADKDEVAGNAVLGIAMRALHDRPVLERADIAAVLEESELHRQLERVRITLEPLSLDDISKLWMTFQCEYRLSAFYEASLVLIEFDRAGADAAARAHPGAEGRRTRGARLDDAAVPYDHEHHAGRRPPAPGGGDG